MSRIWIDVKDGSGVKLGEGPITTARSVRVSRRMDGPGEIQFLLAAGDKRALTLVQPERRVDMYVHTDRGKRLLGSGIVRSIQLQVSASGEDIAVTGVDLLEELRRKSLLLARTYDNQSIADVVDDLVSVASWTADTTGVTGVIDARYDGASVLKALQDLAAQQGLHLRYESGTEIKFGALGDSATFRLVQASVSDPYMAQNDDIALIESLFYIKRSEQVVNWVVPLGAGVGPDSRLTLERSTRSSSYAIQTMTGPDGRTIYYMSDGPSVTDYGQIERILTFDQIAPISNGDSAIIRASNALYDATAAWLERNAVIQEVYRATVRKTRKTIKPGQKIHLRYIGWAYKGNHRHTWVDIDQEMWVIAVTERVGVQGDVVDLELSTVDKQVMDEAEIVVGQLEAINVRNIQVQPYMSKNAFVYRRELDNTHPAVIPIRFTDATRDLLRGQIRMKSRPFRSTAQAAEASGDHQHLMFKNTGVTGSMPALGWDYQAKNAAGGTITQRFSNVIGDMYTFAGSGTHTHTLQYGIVDDSDRPDTARIVINGTDATTALGGPWAVGGGVLDVTLDITTYLVTASGGLRSNHEVVISCDSGQGEVEVEVELYEVIQSLKV